MKKYIILLLLLIVTLTGSVEAYTQKDGEYELVQNLYRQIDLINEKNPNDLKLIQEYLKTKKETSNLESKLIQYIDIKLIKDNKKNLNNNELEINKIISCKLINGKYNGENTNIKLAGIDCFGDEDTNNKATEKLNSLLINKNLKLEFVNNNPKKDNNGNLEAYVFADNLLLNKKLLELGYAQLDSTNTNSKYLEELQKAFNYAKNNNIGNWEKLNQQNLYNQNTDLKTNNFIQQTGRNYITGPRGGCIT